MPIVSHLHDSQAWKNTWLYFVVKLFSREVWWDFKAIFFFFLSKSCKFVVFLFRFKVDVIISIFVIGLIFYHVCNNYWSFHYCLIILILIVGLLIVYYCYYCSCYGYCSCYIHCYYDSPYQYCICYYNYWYSQLTIMISIIK